MAAIKKTLVGNLFVLFRNGIIGTTTSFPGQGVYISYTSQNGRKDVVPDSDFENSDKFKPKQMYSTLSDVRSFDIIRLYRPHNPLYLINGEIISEKDLDNCADLVWSETPVQITGLEIVKSEDAIEFVGNDASKSMPNTTDNSEIMIRTRMFITVNGKEIDPNNLTDTESSILRKLGLL